MFAKEYLSQAKRILEMLEPEPLERMVRTLRECRKSGGRLFLVGSGGGAGHASHAVCDFRKLCGIEAYSPTDNVSELTARINDDGWATCISNWLAVSRLSSRDCVMVFSVGGGNLEKNVSPNLVNAVKYAKEVGARILGIVGRDGGYTAKMADVCVVVPTIDSALVTPHTESFQAVLWHLLAAHPELQIKANKWESTQVQPVTNEVLRDPTKETRIFTIKIFADGAERAGMLEMYNNPLISGFTTNPTLMKKAGIKDYKAFATDILSVIRDRPISFEVFSDDFREMEWQAQEIASWGDNVYVKIPVTNTKGESAVNLIESLARAGVRLNVTALMTLEQVKETAAALRKSPSSYISVFAGRIADTGRDPLPMMRQALDHMKAFPNLELIWASPRELLNLFQADEMGCHIITVTNDILKKLSLVGKDLNDYSLETVKMFYNDAKAAGFTLPTLTQLDSGSMVVS